MYTSNSRFLLTIQQQILANNTGLFDLINWDKDMFDPTKAEAYSLMIRQIYLNYLNEYFIFNPNHKIDIII